MHNVKGLWFYGLAGSGKTLASSYVRELCDACFIVDGDQVRQFVSQDLKYDLHSRAIQIQRIFGICQIAIGNSLFPIASSVYMDYTVFDKCKASGIFLFRVERDFEEVQAERSIYANAKDVIGKDLIQPDLPTLSIQNDGTLNFRESVHKAFEEAVCIEHV